MIVYKNDKKIEKETKAGIIKKYYLPIEAEYDFYSPMMKKLMKETQNIPLKRHHATMAELKDVLNTPRYEILGYDSIVGTPEFAASIKEEFYQLWCNPTEDFVKFLNEHRHTISKYNNAQYKFS